jgi:glycerol-3-phosphate dehydrogenase
LGGRASPSSEAIAAMPGVWRDCLAGTGDLDLSAVRILSPAQYLWAPGALVARLHVFLAAKALRSRVLPLPRGECPEELRHPRFRGTVLRLEEPVLDVRSLIAALSSLCADGIYRLTSDAQATLRAAAAPEVVLCTDQGDGIEVHARRLVLAAGAGNAELLAAMGRAWPAMQLRPLHMVMLQGRLPGLHAHCLGSTLNPRLTITSFPSARGDAIWYLGGELAETGLRRSAREQVAYARQELGELLPWVDLADVRAATLRVDRAEVKQPFARRPADGFVAEDAGVITVWPTKLAFAPRAADLVLESLAQARIFPAPGDTEALAGLARPAQAPLPWEQVGAWI